MTGLSLGMSLVPNWAQCIQISSCYWYRFGLIVVNLCKYMYVPVTVGLAIINLCNKFNCVEVYTMYVVHSNNEIEMLFLIISNNYTYNIVHMYV